MLNLDFIKRINFHVESFNAANVFHTPSLPFYAINMINPLLNSRISTNHDKVEGHSANGEILIKGKVSLG